MKKILFCMIVFLFSSIYCNAASLLDDVSGMANGLIEDVSNNKNTTPIKKSNTLLESLDKKRFIKKDTVFIDIFTSLQWQDTQYNTTAKMNFYNAKIYCSNLNLNGKSNWRIPTKAEFEYARTDIIKNLSYNKKYDYYWTNTKSKSTSKYTYYNTFRSYKHLSSESRTTKSQYIRCVQGPLFTNKQIIDTKIQNKYEEYFTLAKTIDTQEAYEKYINNFPKSPYYALALENIFELAKKQNTIEAYEEYAKKFPNSTKYKSSLENIFELVKKQNTIEAYKKYIKKFPSSPKYHAALGSIFELVKQQNTMEAYNDFIKKYPISGDRKIALENLFKLVQKQNTLEAYGNFIKAYPDAYETDLAVKKVFELSKLSLRSTYKNGKIGERYVPTSEYSSSTPNTTTTYINGNAYTSTTYNSSSSSSGGYNSDVYGYKYLYDITNESKNYYLIEVQANWIGTYQEYKSYRTGAWGGGDKRHKLVDSKKASSYFETFLLAPGELYKDQFEVGEKEPSDLEFKLVKTKILAKDYFEGLVTALNYSVKKEKKNEK